eukprot:gene24934-32492_t
MREVLDRLEAYPPPAFRILSYLAEPQAIVEVCGGVFSPYLHPDKRRELSRIMRWFSSSPVEISHSNYSCHATVSRDEMKVSNRSSAERVIQRAGKLFRSALKITGNELVVSVYSHVVSAVTGDTQLIFNFYSPKVSDAVEVVMNQDEQLKRIGRPILLCRFFKSDIRVDVSDDKRTLHVRPVGIPGVFFPLDTCGRILHRRGMTLK